jgi:hypothetical protein
MPDFPRLRKVFESLSEPFARVSSLVLKEELMKLLTKKAGVAVLMAGLAAVSFAGYRGTTTEAARRAAGQAEGQRASVPASSCPRLVFEPLGERRPSPAGASVQSAGVETDIKTPRTTRPSTRRLHSSS